MQKTLYRMETTLTKLQSRAKGGRLLTTRIIKPLLNFLFVRKGCFLSSGGTSIILELIFNAVAEKQKLEGFQGYMMRLFKYDSLNI